MNEIRQFQICSNKHETPLVHIIYKDSNTKNSLCSEKTCLPVLLPGKTLFQPIHLH